MLPETLLPILRVAIDHMVPRDRDLGGLDVGTETFILELVAQYPEFQETYLSGLTELDSVRFIDLSSDERESQLKRLPQFSDLLSQHAIEAFYTSPAGLEMVEFRVTA